MKRLIKIDVSLYLGYETLKTVKVKAYKRIRKGRIEQIRSHYRGVWGRRRRRQI